MKKARVSAMMLILVSFSIVGVYAYDPPKGASLLGRIYGPWTMGGGLSLTEKGDNTWNFLLNPASTSEEELPILALSYTGIADTSAGGPQGWGSAAMAAFSLPKAYGVWNGSVRLFSAPSSMTSMPFGTFATIGGGFSKKISSGLSVGASAWLAMGGNGSFGWGLWSDIGIVEEFGDMGFLKSPRLGFAFSGIGKEFNYETPPIGMSPGSTASSGFPSAFSPSLGFSADLLNDYNLRIMANIDLRAPSFADLEGEIGLGISYRNMLNLRISAAESLYDIQKKTGRSLWPSITISGSIPLGSKDPQNKGVSAILPAFGFMPLYDSLNSFSIGAQIAWRQHDMSPPEVKLELPPSVGGPPVAYISPNDDSKQDKLEIPLSVKDEQGIVAGWLFKIEDRSSGKVVRTITEQSDLPDRIDSFSSIKKGFGYTKQNVPVPNILDWDGRDDEGNPVPDGTYIVSFHAWDDLGKTNANYDSCMNVVVDRSAPIVNAWVLGSEQLLQGFDVMIFSPDGDNSKDTISFRVQGSIEDNWKYEILNENNVAIRTMEIKARSAPRDFVWDGTDDRGKRVPDGYYRFRLSTMDPAGNTGYKIIGISDDKSDWIVVDTSRPAVKVVADKKAFSPKKEGEAGTAQISFEVESLDNLVTWKEFIQDQNGKTVWTSSGDGSAPPPESFRFGGRDPSGEVLPDGQYRAGIEMKYRNGYSPLSYSESFILDATPPFATIVLDDIRAIFSPDGDGRRDTLAFSLSGSKEDTWKLSIFDEIGKPVYTREYREALPERFEWDGTDSTGRRVIDNKYTLEIESVDVAGNEFKVGFEPVVVDTRTPSAFFVLNREAFSPNDDGIADILGVKLKIDSIDGLLDWKLYVSSALNGSVNAEKTGRQIALLQGDGTNSPPTDFQFDGKGEGALLKEGTYRFELFLEYENGWKTTKLSPEFVIDITAPRAQISRSREFFNPRGETKQSQVIISQIGSREALWIGELRDNQGVLRCKWESKDSQPSEILWDGRTAEGALLPDGIYSYRLFCIDLAGNSFASEPILIGIDTVVKQSSLSADTMAISPNGDGIQDKMTLSISATAMESVQDWQLAILAGQERVMEWKGTGKVPQTIIWEGISLTRLPVPDGSYAAIFRAEYPNGDSTEASLGPLIVDRIAPQATVSLSRLIFSPNGDGRADTVELIQSSVYGDRWNGQIISETGKIVRTWEWYPMLADVLWDGKDQSGKLVSDGVYYYELRSIDAAGNFFILPRQQIIVDAAQKNVSFKVEPTAFSPNDDGVKDLIYLNVNAPKPDTLLSYSLSIFAGSKAAAGQAPVRSWKGKIDIKSQYVWDGMTDAGLKVPDGYYSTYLELEYANGDLFNFGPIQILVDTVPPRISISADPLLFSPNGDGIKDTITIAQESVPGDDWSGRIRSASGATVRSYTWKGQAKNFTWDGKDSNGKLVPNGAYSYEVVSVDAAGNSASASIKGIMVDATKPRVFVTASDNGISPNSDGIRDEVSFSLTVENREGVDSWRFSLLDSKGVERSFFGGSGSDVPTRLVWDGRDLNGQVIEDTFTGKLIVRYMKGDIAEATSSKIVVKIAPPQVEIKVKPEYFSPDDDGVDDMLTFGIVADKNAGITEWKLEVLETAIVESAALQESKPTRSFMLWSGKGMPPSQITWNGKSPKGELVESATDYPFEFTCWDALGNQTKISGIIAVDVLVIRDGDRLKIRVPSIVFRANHADFIGLDSEIVARNEKVVTRIAQILGKFPDYRIRVEGHGNNVGKMLGYSASRIQQEEINELIPLSTERAEVVRKMLVENGVDARRLTVVGLGSSEPVVPFTDVQNRWKNRRVEFVLIKNQ